MIRGSGPRPDPESFAFSVLINFFTDPDPRIRIRVRVTPNSFRKNLNMIFLEEKRIRATFEWIHVWFLHFSFKKDAVPGLRIESGSGPRSGSARLPSHRYRSKVRYRTATDYGPGICIRDRIPYRTVRIRI
jgi:hypothetical protein